MDIYQVSQETLKEIVNSGADVGVIGGWAIWAYNPYKYSMDIDIVLKPGDMWKVREKLHELGFNETSGSHLGKKEFKKALEDGVMESVLRRPPTPLGGGSRSPDPPQLLIPDIPRHRFRRHMPHRPNVVARAP